MEFLGLTDVSEVKSVSAQWRTLIVVFLLHAALFMFSVAHSVIVIMIQNQYGLASIDFAIIHGFSAFVVVTFGLLLFLSCPFCISLCQKLKFPNKVHSKWVLLLKWICILQFVIYFWNVGGFFYLLITYFKEETLFYVYAIFGVCLVLYGVAFIVGIMLLDCSCQMCILRKDPDGLLSANTSVKFDELMERVGGLNQAKKKLISKSEVDKVVMEVLQENMEDEKKKKLKKIRVQSMQLPEQEVGQEEDNPIISADPEPSKESVTETGQE